MTEEKRKVHIHECECLVCKGQSDLSVQKRHAHINLFLSRLTEPQRRWYVATLSEAPDSPGDRQLSLITGPDAKTIRRGKAESNNDLSDQPKDRQRKEGGGRWSAEKNSGLVSALEKVIEPHTAGDPMSSKKWLKCRLADIQRGLPDKHRVSKPVISRLLKAKDYRLRSNRKEIGSNSQHPERDQQFRYIHKQRQEHATKGEPLLSVDTKKKELIGNFKNAGQVWCQEAIAVHTHDFKQDSLGRAVPYGIYDQKFKLGTICLGRSSDSPAFVVDNIALWCATERIERFPDAVGIDRS